MANRITIQPTVFHNYPTGEKTFGFRAYDDYDQAYDNTWSSIPEDDLEVLQKVVDESSDSTVTAMLDLVKETQVGVYIASEYYEWDQISEILRLE